MAFTMPKPISRKMHGMAADYPYAVLSAAAPYLMGFRKEKAPTILASVLGGGTLLASLFTRYEAGAVKKIPFKVHLGLDAVSGLTALAAPWLFGFKSKRARNTFLALGLVALTVTLLTQPANMAGDDDNHDYKD